MFACMYIFTTARVSELTSEIEPTFVPSKIATEAVLGRKMSFCGGVGAGTIR